MRKSLILLLSSLPLLLLVMTSGSGSKAKASPPGAYYHQYQSYPSYSSPAYYAPPVYNYQYQFVYPAAVPLYNSAYVAPTAVLSGQVNYSQQIVTSQSSVQSLVSAANASVASERRAFAQELAQAIVAAQQGGGQLLKGAAQEPVHVAKLRAACAKCHSGGSAEKGLAIFDDAGGYLGLKPADTPKVIFRLTTANPKLRMPPGGQFPPEDKDAIIEGIMTEQPQDAKAEPRKVEDPRKLDEKKGPF